MALRDSGTVYISLYNIGHIVYQRIVEHKDLFEPDIQNAPEAQYEQDHDGPDERWQGNVDQLLPFACAVYDSSLVDLWIDRCQRSKIDDGPHPASFQISLTTSTVLNHS